MLYTGNATARDITVADNQDVAWQPDWVWIKGRPTTSSHTLYDVVRGATKLLLLITRTLNLQIPIRLLRLIQTGSQSALT